MLTDSHCHFPADPQEAQTWIDNAKKEGVTRFINIGTSTKDTERAIKIADMFPEVYATAAIYPHEEIDRSLDELKNELQQLISSSEKVVAVGECGIDVSNWEGGRKLEDQIELFEMQIQLSLENKLPLVIHNRNGDETVLKLLQKYKNQGVFGVIHCFSSNWETAKQFLDLGFYLSFTAMITYPNKKDPIEVVQRVSEDRFLLETDAPYLPPQGFRGQRNEPKYVRIVALKAAEVKNLPIETIEKCSYDNTSRLFRL